MTGESIFKTVGPEDSIAYYQVDCIEKHPEIPILPIRVSFSDQQPRLQIDAPDRIVLNRYLEGRPLSRKEWIDLLVQAGGVIRQGMDHFLDPCCFQMSLHTIFVTEKAERIGTGDVRFLYIPIDPHSPIDPIVCLCGEMLQFISGALPGSPECLFSFEEREMIAGWSTDSLDEGLERLKVLQMEKRLKPHTEHLLFQGINRFWRDKFTGIFHKRQQVDPNVPGFIYLYGGLGMELILIYAAFRVLQHQTRFIGRLVPILIVSAILLGFAVLDLFLLYSKKSPIFIEEESADGFAESSEDSDYVSAFKLKEEKTILLEPSFSSKRIAMICSGIPGTPEENFGQKAYILVDDFLIGRDGSKVDFRIAGLSIGRIHARVIRNENSFFIEDLDSRNGTFVDQRRVKKGQEMLLPDQCKIRFADKEFYFIAD